MNSSFAVGTCASGWHTAEAEISSAYRSFSNEKIHGKMGIYIGLTSANITLEAMPIYYNRTMDVNFNEKFGFERPTQLKEEYQAALRKGLPYPILTVAEYMSVDAEGFCWGRTYRAAGYYCSVFLWSSFVLWILMNLLLVVVPRYGAYTMSLTGLMMLWSTATYYWLLPRQPLMVHIDEVVFHFELGWCFWLVLVSGGLCLMVGSSISIIDLMYPHTFSTVLEMDYGTPFDRHTIIEDSHETKKKKKWVPKLEEPVGVGIGGLLRRLSKRDRDRDHFHRHPGGADNFAFEMDAPKSPWRYPHLMFRSESRKSKAVSFKQEANMPPAQGNFGPMGYLRRMDSKDSSCSSVSSVPHQREALSASMSVPAHAFNKQFRRTDSSDSSTSSLASFGLSFLTRNNSKKTGPAPHATAHHQLHHQLSKQLPHPLAQSHPPEGKFQRGDSSDSVISRGMVARSGVEDISSSSRKSSGNDDVAIVVGSRKNSLTKAVRRNSADHKRDEAAMW